MKTNFDNIPSLKSLHVFESVTRCGSASKAAEELCVTNAAVSLQIKALEEHLGIKLYQRSGRSNELTAQGKELAEMTTKMLTDWDKYFSDFKHRTSNNELAIQTYVISYVKWLGLRLADFNELPAAQEISLKMKTSSHMSFQDDIADIGFVLIRTQAEIGSHQCWHKVFPHYISPICSTQYYQEHQALIDAGRFEELDIICSESDYADWKAWLDCHGSSANFNPRVIAGDKMMVLEMLLNHRGFAMINPVFLKQELDDERLYRPFEQTIHRGEWGFIYNHNDPKEPLYQALIDFACGYSEQA